jgi:hypothetical protein
MAVLVDGPPEILTLTVDGSKHLIHVPRVTRPGAPATELIGIRLPELPAPLPDGFVGHDDSAGEQQLFDVAIAETEAEIEPDRVANNLRRETMLLV